MQIPAYQADAEGLALVEKLLGEQAQRLADDPAFSAALQRLAEKYMAQWRTAPSPEVRETLWVKIHVLDDISAELRAMVGGGDLAGRTLETLERRRTE